MRVLILGGTKDAREIASAIAAEPRFDVTLSLAGRTRAPAAQPVPVRVGGFGGVEGLSAHLEAHEIGALIDATHPFAVRISANAVAAASRACVPLASFVRPAWEERAGDRWLRVADAASAASALGHAPKRVFLAMGRLELAAFAAASQHRYIARMIEEPGEVPLPPNIHFVFARPPFTEEDERKFLLDHAIGVVVSKHSGGSDTYGKIAAARSLGLPVVMIERPEKPRGRELASAAEAVHWLTTLER